MIRILLAGASLALASFGAASAQNYYSGPPPAYSQPPSGYGACPPNYHETSQGCICNQPANFYSPSGGGGYYPVPGGGPPPYSGGGGYNVSFYAPGVRVIGQPVDVPSGQVYVQGAPIYVQAPPVRVAPPQIYLARPKVYVQPSQVTVEPPVVHIAGCEAGQSCEMVGTTQYNGGH